jgi:hypothetical protein
MKHKAKKVIIENLINVPDKGKRIFWAKEIKFLNILIEKYDDEDFWLKLSFPDKFDSLLLLRSGYYAETLRLKYKKFNYIIPDKEEIPLHKEKFGETLNFTKTTKTLRKFLE